MVSICSERQRCKVSILCGALKKLEKKNEKNGREGERFYVRDTAKVCV